MIVFFWTLFLSTVVCNIFDANVAMSLDQSKSMCEMSNTLSSTHLRVSNSEPITSLSIFQWNCRSLYSNIDVFKQYISSAKPDVICLQSVGRRPKELPALDGYFFPPIYKCSRNGVVAVATYARVNLACGAARTPCGDNVLAVSLQFDIDHTKKYNLVNAYFPEGCAGKTEWLSQLNNDIEWIIVGDFNAHHALWGGSGTETRGGGASLAEQITNANLFLLNDSTPTRMPDRVEHAPTAIDLSLVSPSLAPVTSWEVIQDDLGSDHFPIKINIGIKGEVYINKTATIKYNYNKADWSRFRELLTNKEITEKQDLNEQYAVYQAAVTEAANESIPKITNKNNHNLKGNPWWNENCKGAVKNKKYWLRKYKQNYSPLYFEKYKEARLSCRKTIAQAKKEHWLNILQEKVQTFKDTGYLWKTIKKTKNKVVLPQVPLIINGEKITDDKRKAEVLATALTAASQTCNLPADKLENRLLQETQFSAPLPDFNSPLNLPFTVTEVTDAIKKVKSKRKATGVDEISYEMLKHYPSNILLFITKFFNRCWEGGVVPSVWTSALVVPILKHGKPKHDPNSFRPISLTPHTGKIYERLIKSRLDFHLEKHKVIPRMQAGFQRGRGCTDHLVRLSSHIKKSSAKGHPTMATFFDVKSAYDAVWLKRLYHKLADIGLNGHIYNAIVALTRCRRAQVKVGAAVSSERVLDMGVPQGSILAPLLFNIMLSDIANIKLSNSNLIAYADDLAIWSKVKYKRFSERTCKIIRNSFQTDVDTIVDYMDQNGFTLSPEKTSLMFFPARHRVDTSKFYINVNGKTIYASETTRYLGVILDKSLSWGPHTQHLLNKASAAVGLIRVLKCTEGCNNTKALLHVTKAIIRSRLTYGQEAFFAASKTTISKLQARECAILRIVLDLPRCAPQELVYREAGWLPLENERELRCAQYVVRSQAVENSTVDEVRDDFDDPSSVENTLLMRRHHTVAERNNSIANYTKKLITCAGVESKKSVKHIASPFPPWILEKAEIITQYNSLKKDNPLLLTTFAKELIHSKFMNYLHVFTDGSKQNNGRVGCAFTIPEFKIIKQYRLNDNISIYSSELYALYMALSHLNDIPNPVANIALFSDSRSSLESIQNGRGSRGSLVQEIQILIHQLIIRGVKVALVWIPSHVGIRGNETADSAAKRACYLPNISNDIGYTPAEICCQLRSAAFCTHAKHFREEAQKMGWFDDTFRPGGAQPSVSPYLLPLLFRLRTQSLRFKYLKLRCECSYNLSFDHVFECSLIAPVLSSMHVFGIDPSPKTLLCADPTHGWKHTEVFLKKLSKQKVGALL